jgi:ABC-type glycerol-3-phosphate transport system substrate-binding protein
MREWTFFWDVAKANTQWYSPEKVSITVPPAGPGGSKTWAGGWGWAIPRFTKNKDAAKEFIRYISSAEIAPKLARASSFFVTSRNSVMSELGGEGITQYMKLYTDRGVVTPRPYHVRGLQQAKTLESGRLVLVRWSLAWDWNARYPD